MAKMAMPLVLLESLNTKNKELIEEKIGTKNKSR